jgi:putative transposase
MDIKSSWFTGEQIIGILRERETGGRRLVLQMPTPTAALPTLDFLSDAMTDGRRFRIRAVVDDFTRG